MMDAKSYSAVRKDLAKTMERVCDDHSPLIITRKNASAVVMMSLEDYNAIQETAYLLQSPANAARLHQSINGIGKPEPFKFELSGKWSRKINNEHRLVYEVQGKKEKVTNKIVDRRTITIYQCRYHY